MVFALLGGGPHDTKWDQDVVHAKADSIEDTAKKIFGEEVFYGEYFAPEKSPHCGPFHSKTTGSSMGGGQERPTAFFHSAFTLICMAQLFATEPFKRITSFANS